jgi:chitin disaccharide deacetylase
MPVRVKKLIVNADDFGLTSEVNQGVIQSFINGIVTSASLIANGEGFEEAVQLIKEYPSLDIGLHLTLIEEKSVLTKKEIPTLVDSSNYFRKNAYQFLFDYMRNNISLRDIKKELRAQIEKVYSFDIHISHIDSHQHIHMLPGVLEVTLQLADDFGIPYIRNPREKIRLKNPLPIQNTLRIVQQMIINLFCFFSRNKISGYALDNFYGFFHGGHLDKNYLLGIIKSLDEGVTEIMCHPGEWIDGKTWRKYSHWEYNWQGELACLMDTDIVNFIQESGIQLTSFSGIHNV